MGAVTLTDVAALAGVSQPTASRVLNGSVRKPARHVVEAVRKAADELGYIPNAQAQALVRSTSGLLGLVVQDIADPYFSTIAAGVQQASMARGKQMLIAATLRDPVQELTVIESFVSRRADVIVVVGSRWSTTEARLVADRIKSQIARYTVNDRGRIAVVGQPMPGARAVIPGNRAGAAELAGALIATGITEFVVLGGPRQLKTAADRVSGFVSALKQQGLQPRMVVEGDFTRDGGYAAAQFAVTQGVLHERPACVFAVNDVMAIGAMAAFRDAGLRIPQDVQIAGFDDIPTLRDHTPSLTTVQFPLHDMGVQVVELALGDAGTPATTRVPGKVILRQSTARSG